jgi:hypothetical protein
LILKINKNVKIYSSFILALSIFSCSTNQINAIQTTNNKIQHYDKNFYIKSSSSFNHIAYYLSYPDIQNAIKYKSIPDVFYHYVFTQNSEPERITNSNYLQVKNRIESGEWSEDAYLIANPDVKSAIDSGTLRSGYSHWYEHAQYYEPWRKLSPEYINAKSAIDSGFNEKAYRLAWSDIDNAIKNNSLQSSYSHYSYAKNNEQWRITNPRYLNIKSAIESGFDEKAYLLAFPDIKSVVDSGQLKNGLEHYINYGVNENRLNRIIYQDAKYALMLDFDETRYRMAFPDVDNAIKSGSLNTAFQHFYISGKSENRLKQNVYKFTKNNEFIIKSLPIGTEFNMKTSLNGDSIILSTKITNNISETYGQKYDNQFNTVNNEFKVNSISINPSIAFSSSGDFVLSWASNNSNGSFQDIYSQRYNSNGIPQGSEFKVNTYTTGSQNRPYTALDSNGNFVVTWQSYGQDGYGFGIYAQRYNSNGVPQGSEFRVNSYTRKNQIYQNIAMDSNGNFVITWQSYGQDYNFNGIYAQRYNSNGVPQGSEFRVNSFITGEQMNPSIAMDSTGNFVVAWSGHNVIDGYLDVIYAQKYNNQGIKIGNEFQIDNLLSTTIYNMTPSIGMDSSGDFIITWYRENHYGESEGIFARRFNSNLTPKENEFKVNYLTNYYQGEPIVNVDSSGNFIIKWREFINNVSNYYVKKFIVN